MTDPVPPPDRQHFQIPVKVPWFSSLADGERNFTVYRDLGFRLGDVVHLWEEDDYPSEAGLVLRATGKRLARQVTFVLSCVAGLVDGWAVIGLGQVRSSGPGNAGAEGVPQLIPLIQPSRHHHERLAA